MSNAGLLLWSRRPRTLWTSSFVTSGAHVSKGSLLRSEASASHRRCSDRRACCPLGPPEKCSGTTEAFHAHVALCLVCRKPASWATRAVSAPASSDGSISQLSLSPQQSHSSMSVSQLRHPRRAHSMGDSSMGLANHVLTCWWRVHRRAASVAREKHRCAVVTPMLRGRAIRHPPPRHPPPSSHTAHACAE